MFKMVDNTADLSESASESGSEQDSDEELQTALSKGKIKPGLNYEVAKPKLVINMKDKMKTKLSDIRPSLEWIERLDLTNEPAPSINTEEDQDTNDEVHNDFKREMRFYRQAQATVLEGIERLQKLNIPTKRPEDYFAQMAKSDEHMNKVREKLVAKQLSADKSEKAKKLRELRKFGKKVQQDVLKKRQKDKKEMLDAVKKYRKGQQDQLDFLEDDKKEKKPQVQNKRKESSTKSGKKRKFKNDKFGFGGQKKRSKYNTSESSRSMADFRKKDNSSKSTIFRRAGNKNRPGKSRRKNIKNKKN